MKQLDQQTIETHVKIVAWLNIAGGIFFLLFGAILFLFLSGIAVFAGDAEALPILVLVGLFVGFVMAMLALPSILAGVGLLRQKEWGRILAIIVAMFDLLNFPIGTAIGVYALWVLLQRETSAYFVVPKMA